jgi:hypothetical protein
MTVMEWLLPAYRSQTITQRSDNLSRIIPVSKTRVV